ncbi:MAG: dTDP-4-dehydrorhamnose reductase [Thermoguttaceae bacterium]
MTVCILLIGAGGQVGCELRRTLAPLGKVVAASRAGEFGPRVDLARPGDLTRLLDLARPDVVVNAAAYTAVDRAEREAALAERVNSEAVAELAALAAERGTPVVHYSTDFVFSGQLDRPYTEDDAPAPLSVYGRTKLAGEQALLASGGPAIVFRTSWVYGLRGANFLCTMLRLFRSGQPVRVVDDQVGAPTWSRMLAEVTALVLYRVLRGECDLGKVGGLYHVCGAGQVTWHGFATAICEEAGLSADIAAIATAEYPTPAQRPHYSVLDTRRLWGTFGLELPHWRDSLRQCLEDFTKS